MKNFRRPLLVPMRPRKLNDAAPIKPIGPVQELDKEMSLQVKQAISYYRAIFQSKN